MMPDTFQTFAINSNVEDFLSRNEKGDAELFVQNFIHHAVYDHAENAWYLWNGQRWEADKTGRVFGYLDTCAAEYLKAAATARASGNRDLSEAFTKRANSLLANKRMKSILDIASRLPGIALQGNEWDAAPMVLPVANGNIDLRTGNLNQTIPLDYIRTYSPTEFYGIDTPAPLWEKVLSDIFNNDNDLIAFFARLLGYGITGETKEQILPILWGEGANGKSTIMDTIMSVLGGDFCFNTQSESLMDIRQGDGNAAKPFVVSLRSKRLVFASESKEGQKLNTGLVKQLTGDGYITARALFQEPVTFKQTHKIFLITNHCPSIPDSEDFAIWRRVIRVPFSIRFKENPVLSDERKIDKNLSEQLKAEYPGILAWLVRGCLDWQKQGLNPPKVVTKSTEDYRMSEDITAQFISDCIEQVPGAHITASGLYSHFVTWCASTGDDPIDNKKFGNKISKLFGKAVTQRVNGGPKKVYQGIKIK